MIFITIIAEEKVFFERGEWDEDTGRWLSDPDTWHKHVQRHIFAYSPDDDKLIRPEMYIIKDRLGNDRRINAPKFKTISVNKKATKQKKCTDIYGQFK